MRVLIVHNLLWAHYKAAVFQELQQLTQGSDVEVHVLQIARNERSRAGLETLNPDAPRYTYSYELLFDSFWEETTVAARTRALLAKARAYRPQVINITGYYDPAQLALLLWAKLRGIRVILQNESTPADNRSGGIMEWVKRGILSLCDGFFCFGTHSAEYLLRLGVPARKILLKKNAVDNTTLLKAFERALPQRTNRQQALGIRPTNFIYVGRLIEVKNLDGLLNAFAEARKQATNPDRWGLLLLGDGPLHDTLQQQIKALGLPEVVRLVPGEPWYRVPEYLALADVLVLPSQSEPWGLVVNEAMVCGLPVIVSDRCGCAIDLVRNGENGFIFNYDQPNALARCLHTFMNKEADRAQMGEAARQFIAPYAPQAVAREMLAGFVKVGKS